MYTNEQIEEMKRRVREQDDMTFELWLKQFDAINYYTKEVGDRYDHE